MRIVLAVSRFPWPARRGNDLRTLQMADALSTAHQVTVLVPQGVAAPPAGLPYAVELYRRTARDRGLGLLRAVVGGPLQSGLYASADLVRRLRAAARHSDLVVLQLVRLGRLANLVGDRPLLVDLVDSLALNFAQRATLDRLAWRPFLHAEASRLRAAERDLIRRSRATLLVCERDREHLAVIVPERDAARLRVVPIAVAAPATLPAAASHARPTIALTGNLGYFPTREGARWWLREVWPELSRRHSGLRLLLAGSRPPAPLRRELERAGGELHESPPDLQAVLGQATLAIAPARCGSGVPIKVLEAWAAGVPVVAARWSAAGTAGVPGEDLLVAEGAGEWIAAVDRLLGDPGLRRRIAGSALACLRREYAPQRVREAMLEAVAAAAAAPG